MVKGYPDYMRKSAVGDLGVNTAEIRYNIGAVGALATVTMLTLTGKGILRFIAVEMDTVLAVGNDVIINIYVDGAVVPSVTFTIANLYAVLGSTKANASEFGVPQWDAVNLVYAAWMRTNIYFLSEVVITATNPNAAGACTWNLLHFVSYH